MDSIYPTTDDTSSIQYLWSREQISQLVLHIRLEQHEGASLNRSASVNGVPHTTAQNWMRNRGRLEQDSGLAPAIVEFLRITPRARVPT